MGISFTEPLWWLLLPLLFWFAWRQRLPWLRVAVQKDQRRRELRRIFTRLALLTLLVAALASPGIFSVINRQAVIMALDVSASIGPAAGGGEAWIREALAVRPTGAAAGVVAFGRKALVEEPPGLRPEFYRAATDPGEDASLIGEALRYSQAILPRDFRRRVVLLTDGRDTGEDAVAAARALYAGGTRVDVVPLGAAAGSDVKLSSMRVASRARVGENTAIEVMITSDLETGAELFLERDGEMLASRTVLLRPGVNRLALSAPAGEAGLHRYQARVVARDGNADYFSANNEAGAIQEVAGPPRILVLSPVAGEARGLVEALHASGNVEVDLAEPASAPRGVTDWARYQAVFLVNVPAYSLGETVMGDLETYVRDAGGGLVMTGGPDSFGPGGYSGTPLEGALPVEMDIRGRGELPSLGLILVIDKSGSMSGLAGGADKMALAREAAARSVSMLTERDRVGVLAFDSLPWWVASPGPLKNKEELQKLIGGIQADGGTEIYPPLLSAYQALRDLPTQVRHIILLTDGMSASGGDYQWLMSGLRSAGITLSTVAVGAGADAGMLQALSELGRGRFYQTMDADSIPSIFTRETIMATRSFAVNERFYPLVLGRGPLLRGLDQTPPLDGYITVTPKNHAETLLVSPRGDPVLSVWQHGLGRAVAWTPDTGGRWSAAWSDGDAFPRLWGNILSWILPADQAGSVHVRPEIVASGSGQSGQSLKIEVDDAGRWQEVRSLGAVITGPDGSVSKTDLKPAGPGHYQALLPVDKPGAYLVAVTGRSGGRENLLARSGAVAPYPDEYRQTGVDLEALRAIARAGGGAVLEKPLQAFADNLPPVRSRRDLTVFLLSLAALLWLTDVAGRRLSIGPEDFAALGRAGRLLKERIFPGRGQAAGTPGWTGSPLSRVRDLRNQPGQAPGSGDGGKPVEIGFKQGRIGGVARPGDNIARDSGDDVSNNIKPDDRQGSPEATASRLLEAKRRGFGK